jgi:hypothetical protein
LLADGMMLNSVVCLLADKGVITKVEYGDFLHVQSTKHPELGLLRTDGGELLARRDSLAHFNRAEDVVGRRPAYETTH